MMFACLGRTIFFPGLFFYVFIESPNPKNPEVPTLQAPNPINWKPQPQKPNMLLYYNTPTPNHKWSKLIKNYKK